ncbi:hypothetical protein GWK47_047538 [Chionoecetes opilio]|uniref:Uncharacterized protein n=1 Tax=Chionoecetes opilio TaxID=41210 RepID=A0A8J5CG83_CHIOP|nr:hypothetical protein GWK47_047538 [Chionoecetes opilio]
MSSITHSETDEYALRSPEEELHQGPPAAGIKISSLHAVSQDDTSSRGMLISEDKLVFFPPLYIQRYQAVQEIITSSKVPVNKNSKYRVQPFMADFLIRRQEPLTVKVVCGEGPSV